MTPVIGLTCDYDLKRNLREAAMIYPDYFEAVEQAGAVPVLIPPIRSRKAMRTLVERIDAVVFIGGDDYHPKLYGQEPHSEWEPMLPRREVFDLDFAAEVLETGLPVLGICGGLQLLNLSLGGSLIQHIPDAVPDALAHTAKAPEISMHDVQLDPHTLLNDSSHPRRVRVRSYHHQAIDRLAENLRVTGKSSDGVIEVVEGKSPSRFLLGVQWHPEKSLPVAGPDVEFHLGIFHKLAAAALAAKS